jgi:integrase
MRVNLYKRGRTWWGQWTDRGEVCRESTDCTDFKAAQLVAKRWEREAADPSYRASYQTTFGQSVERFLVALKREGKAAGTVNMYGCKTAHLARIIGAATAMGYVDAGRVDAYIAKREGEGASPNTIHKELTALRRVLRGAKRRGEYHLDPRSVMPEKFSTGYEPRERYVTPDELERINAELEPHEAAQVDFLVATGARRSELWNTRVEDIDFTAETIHLRGTKTNKSRRTIPMLPFYRPILERSIRRAHKGQGGALHARWDGINNRLRRVCERLKIPHVSPNDLRRTNATWLVLRGVRRDLAGQLLGHADDTMVRKIYAQIEQPESLGTLVNATLGDVQMLCNTPDDSGDEGESGDSNPSEMVGHDRLELSANGLRVRCSTN